MERVVSSLNETIGESDGVFLDLIRWETHAWPGFGADAQDVINREIEPGDIFIGIMWRRIGTPTARAISGTVEEFERAYELWLRTGRPTLMLYFKTEAFYPTLDELTQFRSVLEFKQLLRDKGALYWEYDRADEFETTVYRHLYKEVRSHVPRPDEDPHRRLVLGVLESSRNVGQGYRTVAGLARATGLSERETKRVLESNPALIMKSRTPDAKGAALYRLHSSRHRASSPFVALEGFHVLEGCCPLHASVIVEALVTQPTRQGGNMGWARERKARQVSPRVCSYQEWDSLRRRFQDAVEEGGGDAAGDPVPSGSPS